MSNSTCDDLQVDTGAERRDFALSIGEVFTLNQIAPSHEAGVPFDFPGVIGTTKAPWPLSSSPDFYVGLAESLAEKGVFERLGGRGYCLTDLGEACWKALVGDSWKRSRQGAGIGWKRKRS